MNHRPKGSRRPVSPAAVCAAALLTACGGPPEPGEIVIRAEDLQMAPIVDPVVPESDTVAFLPDTIRFPADSLLPDSLAADTLGPVSADSLADSLVTVPDTLPAPETTVDTQWVCMAVEVRGSLYQSLSGAKGIEPDVLGAHCVRCLWWDLNPWRDLIAGDSLYLLYDTLGSTGRENSLVCLRYVPVPGSANSPFTVYAFLKAGDNYPSMWYADGKEAVRILDRMPLSTWEEVTGIYGEPREGHTHAGIDWKAPEGTPVRTVMGGTVTRINWNTAYNGYCVEVDMGGYFEIFLHLQAISQGVTPGAELAAGQQIGAVGNTGRSYTPHLHYQINDSQGNAIDPFLYYSSHTRWLGEGDLESFRRFMETCDEVIDRGGRT